MIALPDRLGSSNQLPPHSRDAERSILGAVMRDPELLSAVVLVIGPDDFFFDAHQRVFRAVLELDRIRQPVELLTVHDRLNATSDLEDVGGVAYLAELWEACPTAANSDYYARVIRDNAIIRRLIHAVNEILRDCYDRSASGDELVAMAEQKIRAIADGAIAVSGQRLIAELCRELLNRVDQRLSGDGPPEGLLTGLMDLDGLLGGLKPGHLIAIGARTSIGKTSMALNFAVNIALAGTPVLFFSLEMTADELAARVLAMGSGVPTHRFTRGDRLDQADVESLAMAASSAGVGGCPIYVDDTPGQTAGRLAAGLRRAVARHRVGLAVVDYLQLMTPDDRRENRATQVAELSRTLKLTARACGVPIIVLAQLNRESERENRKPRLSDFRESGGIEQDCDEVILLHRPSDQPDDAPVWMIDADVAKHRNGPTGVVTLAYRRAVTRFENSAREW
jgi:replicative DNA helicase